MRYLKAIIVIVLLIGCQIACLANYAHVFAEEGDVARLKTHLRIFPKDLNAVEEDCGYTPLHSAVSGNKPEAVKALIVLKANVNTHAKGYFLMTPLHTAASRGYTEIVKILLEAGADPNAKDDSQETPLFDAVTSEKIECVELLLKAKADPNARDKVGGAPLHNAAEYGLVDMAKLLIARGANRYAADVDGEYPAHVAARWTRPYLLPILVRSRTEADDHAIQPVNYAAAFGKLDDLKQALDDGAPVNAKDNAGWTPLMWAAACGKEDVVEELIRRGANVNASSKADDHPLDLAVSLPDADIVKQLIDAKADPNVSNAYDDYPVYTAALKGEAEILEMLLKAKADPNVRNSGGDRALGTTVHSNFMTDPDPVKDEAEREREYACAKLLLEYGANPDAEDNDGYTTLNRSVWNDDIEHIKLLLAHGASVWACKGNPLCGAESAEVTELLISKGLRVEDEDEEGWRAIHCAVFESRAEVVRVLADHGASLDSKTSKPAEFADKSAPQGSTPLHVAVKKNDAKMCELLLELGADPTVMNDLEERPLDSAARAKSMAVVRALVAGGATYTPGFGLVIGDQNGWTEYPKGKEKPAFGNAVWVGKVKNFRPTTVGRIQVSVDWYGTSGKIVAHESTVIESLAPNASRFVKLSAYGVPFAKSYGAVAEEVEASE